VPPPPVGEDTVRTILASLYAQRAQLQGQNLPPTQQESLLRVATFQLLSRYGVDSVRWDRCRQYYAAYPERWQRLLEALLESP